MYIRPTFQFPQFTGAALATVGVQLDPKGFEVSEAALASVGLAYRRGTPATPGRLVVTDQTAFDKAVRGHLATQGRYDRNGVFTPPAPQGSQT